MPGATWVIPQHRELRADCNVRCYLLSIVGTRDQIAFPASFLFLVVGNRHPVSREFRDLLLSFVINFRLVLTQEGTDRKWRDVLRDIDRGLIWGSLDAPLGYRTRDDHHDHPAPILHAGYVRGFSLHRNARPAICACAFLLPVSSVTWVSKSDTRMCLIFAYIIYSMIILI